MALDLIWRISSRGCRFAIHDLFQVQPRTKHVRSVLLHAARRGQVVLGRPIVPHTCLLVPWKD